MKIRSKARIIICWWYNETRLFSGYGASEQWWKTSSWGRGEEGRKEEGEGGQNFSTARCRLVRNQRSVWRQVCVTDGGPKSGIYSKRQLMLQLFLPSSFAATWAGTGLIVNRVAIDNVISIIRFRAPRSPRPSSESLRPSLGRSDDAYSELLLSLILCAPGTL